MKRIAIIMILFFFAGCHGRKPSMPAPVVPVRPATLPTEQPSLPDEIPIMPEPPEVVPKSMNWLLSLQAINTQLVNAQVIDKDASLLVNKIKNESSATVNTQLLTNELKALLRSNRQFNVINNQALQQAKEQLGLLDEDNLNTRQKAVALAERLQATHLLITHIQQQKNQLIVSSDVMQLPSGEIIWQVKVPAERKEDAQQTAATPSQEQE